MNQQLQLLKLLADQTRLDILNILMKEDSYIEKIACELSLTPATICYHMKKMENAGVVQCSRSQFYMIYSLNSEIFDRPLRDIVKSEKPLMNTDQKYRREVLSNFFQYGRLTHIPAQQKKKIIVLEEISKSFEKGRKYSEEEINEVIHRFHEDHCTIRRELISFGFMERDANRYWIKDNE